MEKIVQHTVSDLCFQRARAPPPNFDHVLGRMQTWKVQAATIGARELHYKSALDTIDLIFTLHR